MACHFPDTSPGDPLLCSRTLKYFQAIAHHRWLLNYRWVLDSLKKGQILPEVCGEIIYNWWHCCLKDDLLNDLFFRLLYAIEYGLDYFIHHLCPLLQEDYEMQGDSVKGRHEAPQRSRLATKPLLGHFEICCPGKLQDLSRGKLFAKLKQ